MNPKHHSSYIELSESALKKNIRFLKKTIGKGVQLSSVIKGNAYGHGIKTFVPLAERCGIDHFSVFSASEAMEAVNYSTKNSRFMIMGDLHPDEIPWAIENQVHFYIYNINQLEKTIKFADKLNKTASVHLELETGMNRFGLDNESLPEAVSLIKENTDRIIVEGVCTHYSGAESVSNFLRIQNQKKSFSKQCKWLQRKDIHNFMKHSASSAAALIYPETRMDMVRIGIAQYGYWPTEEVRMHYFMKNMKNTSSKMISPLKRILTWKSRIMNLKEVGPGEFVGYGNAYLTTKKQKIAAIPVGYYHGFARNLSNLGRVLVGGKRTAVVGVVNMNMMLINVTDIKDVKLGDEVVIIGKQNKLKISVTSFSDMTNYLNYEVLTRLPQDIPRIIVD
ncbi:MAG: alanine racemase [Candidatus Electryonea clarkiae]|nr:alanine racemase [Candidatus Electryonea clarkiae]MDP8287664.1 alanine racemase [Candidatus Electryonea clarkiae]